MGFIEKLSIEIIFFFLVLFTKFGPKFDLLVENLPYLLQLLLFLNFLLLELLFMEVIAKLLNLSPFVLANI